MAHNHKLLPSIHANPKDLEIKGDAADTQAILATLKFAAFYNQTMQRSCLKGYDNMIFFNLMSQGNRNSKHVKELRERTSRGTERYYETISFFFSSNVSAKDFSGISDKKPFPISKVSFKKFSGRWLLEGQDMVLITKLYLNITLKLCAWMVAN